MKRPLYSRSRAGFSLVEVMVALVVISIGLLGIAKMQALALSSTGEAKMRSLASLEAASLASTMRADRAYWAGSWAGAPAALTVTTANGAVTGSSDGALQIPPASLCQTASPPCSDTQVAAEDLAEWVAALGGALPNSTASITCNVDATGQNPVSCTVTLNWTENVVALNTATNAGMTQAQNATARQNVEQVAYTLIVEP